MPVAKDRSVELSKKIDELTRKGMTQRQIASKLHIAPSTVCRYQNLSKSSGGKTDGDDCRIPDNGVVSFSSAGDTAKAEYLTKQLPTEQTLEGILKECGADLSVWRVKEWSYKAWTTGMKLRINSGIDGDKEKIDKISYGKQYSIHVVFQRIAPKVFKEASDLLWAKFRDGSKSHKRLSVKKSDPMLGVVCLFDAHFAKLAWGAETGKDYDLQIAEDVWCNAIEDLLARSPCSRIGKWVLPIGNDLVHIDNPDNKTRNGTPQDTDGRYAKIIATAASSAKYAVERLASVADVDVVWVPGNHDLTTSFHIAHYLSGVFHKHDGVSVDVSPSPRKYVTWNEVLLGFTHGNEEKIADLPAIMATEMKTKGWAKSKVADWFLGHVHHSQKFMTKHVGEHKGVTIRTMRSLASTDSWHHRKGYIGSIQSAEAHFYTRSYWDSCISVIARTTK